MNAEWLAPLLVWIPATQVLALAATPRSLFATVAVSLGLGVALLADDVPFALLLLALVGGVQAARAWRKTRAGGGMLAVAAASVVVAAGAQLTGRDEVALVAAFVAIALRAGVWPLHGGVAALCDRAPADQIRQIATLLPLIFVYLRHLDHVALAYDTAIVVVQAGAAATLVAALLGLVATDLRAFYRAAVVMHGGLIVMTIGAAGRGHYGAALFAAITAALAIGGLGAMVSAVEDRAGDVSLASFGGRARAFPRLAAGFTFFGAAGVGLPGTAGFVADDLLLHALWQESVAGTVAAILAAATLAIATWGAVTRVFFGRPTRSAAPDLGRWERIVALSCAATLVILGFAPRLLMDPANAILGAP